MKRDDTDKAERNKIIRAVTLGILYGAIAVAFLWLLMNWAVS
jgi:hypothetical protein